MCASKEMHTRRRVTTDDDEEDEEEEAAAAVGSHTHEECANSCARDAPLPIVTPLNRRRRRVVLPSRRARRERDGTEKRTRTSHARGASLGGFLIIIFRVLIVFVFSIIFFLFYFFHSDRSAS